MKTETTTISLGALSDAIERAVSDRLKANTAEAEAELLIIQDLLMAQATLIEATLSGSIG